MAIKRKKTIKELKAIERLKDIAIACILIFIAILIFFAESNSIIGLHIIKYSNILLGEYYKIIVSPILLFLGIFILSGKIIFRSGKLLIFLIFLLSITSLTGLIKDYSNVGFDIHSYLIEYLGNIPTGFILVFFIFGSLGLLFKISYNQVINSTLNSASGVSGNIINNLASKITNPISIKKYGKKSIKELNNSKNKKNISKEEEKILELEEKIARLKTEKEKANIHKKINNTQQSFNLLDSQDSQDLLKNKHKKISIKKLGKKTNSKTSIFNSKLGDIDALNSSLANNLNTNSSFNIKTNKHKNINFNKWELPNTNLLDDRNTEVRIDINDVEAKKALIEKTLLQFRIPVEMHDYRAGPTVVQYRLRPKRGIKLSRIEGLKKDLALALHAKSIRIQAPIPGEGMVGIEVPNDMRSIVGIKEILSSVAFKKSKSKLTIALGKNINGDPIVADLAKMPHLLIAGQTGAGKSVGMNAFLISLLFKNSPSELRLILIDPKRVELGIYNNIPHLLSPVINSPDKALNSLKWSVAEMLRRYDILQASRCRNLEEYNNKSLKKDKLPFIVIVIDELADLMMSGNKKEVESSIARIAQMARAVGMHLIIATQRPSVDVITGLIKANVPSRMAFTVASQIDSRTILDRSGAEDLLGRGDMLYYPTGAMGLERIQGLLVETDEVEAVINHIKRTIDPDMLDELYDKSVTEGEKVQIGNGLDAPAGDFDEDPKIIEQAILEVRSQGKASTSLLQRKLKLGYARAARVMDILEELKIVGPPDGSKPRELL